MRIVDLCGDLYCVSKARLKPSGDFYSKRLGWVNLTKPYTRALWAELLMDLGVPYVRWSSDPIAQLLTANKVLSEYHKSALATVEKFMVCRFWFYRSTDRNRFTAGPFEVVFYDNSRWSLSAKGNYHSAHTSLYSVSNVLKAEGEKLISKPTMAMQQALVSGNLRFGTGASRSDP